MKTKPRAVKKKSHINSARKKPIIHGELLPLFVLLASLCVLGGVGHATVLQFNLTNVPLNLTGLGTYNPIFLDLKTGDYRNGSALPSNASMDIVMFEGTQLQPAGSFIWCSNTSAVKVSAVVGNITIDMSRVPLIEHKYNFNGDTTYANCLSNPVEIAGSQTPITFVARDNDSRMALWQTFPDLVGQRTNMTIYYQTDGTAVFPFTTPSDFSGTYHYIGRDTTPYSFFQTGWDVALGYNYAVDGLTFPTYAMNFTDFATRATGSTPQMSVVDNSKLFFNESTPATLGIMYEPYATAICQNLPPANYTTTIDIAQGNASFLTYCLKRGSTYYKIKINQDLTEADSTCSLQSAQGIMQINSSLFGSINYYWSFVNQTGVLNPPTAPSYYDWQFNSNFNTIFPGYSTNGYFDTTQATFSEAEEDNQVQNYLLDTGFAGNINLISCSLVPNYQQNIFTEPAGIAPGGLFGTAYINQQSICFNLTSQNTCGGGTITTYGIIRAIKGFNPRLSSQVFDFAWRIYNVNTNDVAFSQTAFIPTDPLTAVDTLTLLWNTSRAGTTKLIYSYVTPSGIGNLNTSSEKIETLVAHNITISANAGVYSYWLVTNVSGVVYTSDMRNFTIGGLQGDSPLGSGIANLEAGGFCSGSACVWIIGIIILGAITLVSWRLMGQKPAILIGLVTLFLESVHNLLPQYLLIPIIVLLAFIIAHTFGLLGGGE